MNEHCDRCGALAKARYVMATGHDLFFCGHHARQYKDNLEKVSQEDIIYSELELVNA